MSFVDCDTSTFLTDASSAATFNTSKTLTGGLYAIQYVRNSTGTAMSTAAGVTITAENSTHTILSISPFNSTVETMYFPRKELHTTAGSTMGLFDMVPLANERLTFTISSGGAAKGGTFRTFVV